MPLLRIRFVMITCVIITTCNFPSSVARAAGDEPAFCSLENFRKHEIPVNGKTPKRLHAYRIGKLTLAGMAVGESKPSDVMGIANEFSLSAAPEDYCTWYFNEGNAIAEKIFNWHNLPKPTGTGYQKMTDRWMSIIGDQFDQQNVSFVSCAINRGFIGLGCNGQEHRGPSVFAMILSYSGCTPEHSAEIVDYVWANNGIKTEMRIALAQRASELAAAHPQQASLLRAMMKE